MTLKKLFPYSFRAKGILGLIITIIVYLVIGAVFGVLISLLRGLFLIGALMWILGIACDLYCIFGLILAILVFLHIVK